MSGKRIDDSTLNYHEHGFWWFVILMILIAILAIVIAGPVISFGATVEEEELIERDVAFSIPRHISKNQRQMASDSGFSFLTGTSFFGGTDGNTHRSPADIIHSSEPWGYWLYMRSYMRFSKKSRFLTTANWKRTDYPGQSNANYRRGHLSNWLSARLSNKLELNLDFDFSAKSDDATKITGETYIRDYSYLRYAGEIMLLWSISGGHRILLGGELIQKDYGEKGGLNSIDWSSKFFAFRYRYRLGAFHYIRIWYSFGNRKYRDEPASLRDGTELPDNPNEKHRYHEAMIGYAVPAAGWLDVSFQYKYRTKEDLFEGYESWGTHRFAIWAGIHLTQRFELSMELTFKDREYKNLLGDIEQPLEYVKWDNEIGLRYRIFRALWMFGSLSYYNRDTNLSSGVSYRDYKGLTTSVGASIFFLSY